LHIKHIDIAFCSRSNHNSGMPYNLDFKEFKFSHKVTEYPDMISGFFNHSHNLYELLLFIEGDVEYVIENKRYTLKPYDLLFIKPGEHHYLILKSRHRYERMVMRFPDYIVPKMIEPSLLKKTSLYNIEDSELLTLFKQFDTHASRFAGEKLNVLFMSMLTQLLIYFSEIGDHPENPPVVDETVEQILQYINDHICTPISINDICTAYYISKTKLYRIFFEAMKTPIAQYIRNKKIILAYNLIKNGQKPTQVYEEIGFTDYSTFYRTYIKVIGTPPSAKEEV
jgi:AraC-like DNA-binding protein